MKTKNYFHFSVFLILSLSLCTCLTIGRAFHCFAQGAAINSTGAAANNSAMLDVSSTNQGIRIPRVKLLSTTDVTTILNPTNSLLVFDSLAAGDITTPGFFYWDASNTKWVKLLTTGTGWQLTGNSGTDSTANFIGTTDSRPLVIKTNNTEKIRVMANGNVGIGTTNPNYKFQVNDYSTGILNLLKLQNTNTVGVGTGSRAVFS
ncbi:MAG: hypothetical protein HGB12_14510, partial [Bacteroidetes bacterium]|nr:hypothetical protein [Bacteroidota bacterium]